MLFGVHLLCCVALWVFNVASHQLEGKGEGWRRWCDGGRGEGDGVMGEGCN